MKWECTESLTIFDIIFYYHIKKKLLPLECDICKGWGIVSITM